ncbi:MAG TPA: hypothetical protein VHQ47_04950 [Phycisphaerae bacterium]|nr:hypothetical protein [Phycisphaerae bacterium]
MTIILHLSPLLAQIATRDPSAPVLQGDFSPASSWIISALLLVGIMLVAFKQAKRNHLDKAD